MVWALFLTGQSEFQRCPLPLCALPQPHAAGQTFLSWAQGYVLERPKSSETMCKSLCVQGCVHPSGERGPLS